MKDKPNENHAECGLFCTTKEPNKMHGELYNRALMEFEDLKNFSSILREPEFARRVFSPVYWHAYDRLEEIFEEKDYFFEEVIFWFTTGGGVFVIIMLSFILGVKKYTAHREEGGEENIKLNMQERDD
jgi:hypothetical protein